MESLKIVAEMKIRPENLEEAKKLIREVVTASQAESGNISYIATEDTKNAAHIFILEEWKSEDAIASHNETQHFKNFMKAIEPYILDASITTLKSLS